DVKFLICAVSILSLVGGYLQTVQPIYLSLLGFDAASIGLLVSVTTLSGPVRMFLYSIIADRYGRRKVLAIMYLIEITFFVIYYFSTNFVWFVIAAIFAGSGFTSMGLGGTIHQALVTDKSDREMRNMVFSFQTFIAFICSIIGSTLSGLPEYIEQTFGFDFITSIKPLFILGIIATCLASLLVLMTTEESTTSNLTKKQFIPQKSRRLILKFAITNSIMGVGGGIFFSIVSLWFYQAFRVEMSEIGYILAIAKIIELPSYLIAPFIASKIGLVKAYFATRISGAAIMLIMPLMPTAFLAAILFGARSAILHMSLPLKTSYMMALLSPEERASSASIIQLLSTGTRSATPPLGGYLMENVSVSLPVYIAAAAFTTEAVYYYFTFQKIKPPEERSSVETTNTMS
ncbi:MAG: MFS transporter, partial [Candidatus Bathyarchaeota archaeon]